MRIAITNKNTTNKHSPQIKLTLPKTLFLFTFIILTQCSPFHPKTFNPERAYKDVEYQLSLGPRTTGSQAHQGVRRYIKSELEASDWAVETPEQIQDGRNIYNIIGKRGDGSQLIVIGAHYDSRLLADRDPDQSLRNQPVPGANDGASGVAVLLELARVLPQNLDSTIWLVFFDAEDNGNIPGYDWIMGSRNFVQNLQQKPNLAIIIDMIGDADLNIYQEKNSDVNLTKSIWDVANKLGYNQFIPIPKHRILDDHLPFIEAGIPAVDIIDIDYPYYHTTHDTLDKVSVQSLKTVGETLHTWILEQNDPGLSK